MRPIILGMNNPHSSDPEMALSPTGDPGSAGNRLWNYSGMTETQYRLSFVRRNLLGTKAWATREARASAEKFLDDLEDGSTVIVLGFETWKAFGFRMVQPCRSLVVSGGSTLWFVPHPSGRNLWFNEEGNREMVGQLLRRLSA